MGDEWAGADATEQARAVRRGDVKPVELVEAAIERIERLDPSLNAVIHRHFERARDEASGPLPDGPFRGVPFLLKDLACGNRAGDPIHWGTRFLKAADFRAPTTSFLVQRFLAAGLVVVGRTNVPELGAWSITEPDAYGPTRNPWSLDHAAGGSSGGAAAATAAGLVPFAHASDGGGSIRNPASQCGLVGLKPSRGRVSLGPDTAEPWAGMTFEFAVTRSVRDAATLLDCVHGPMPGDPYTARPPTRTYAEEPGSDPGVLRIGFVECQPDGEPLHPECATALRAASATLESLGHQVAPESPAPLRSDALLPHVLNVIASNQARDVERFEGLLGRSLSPDELDADNWRVTELGRAVTATQFIAATDAYNQFRREVLAWWDGGFDLLLTPTITRPSPRVGEIVPCAEKPLDAFMRSGALLPFCVPFNITGQPAISLPLHWSADGLPVGVQLVADAGREDLLLRVAAQLEAETGWANRRPPLHA
jgi:amidase